ncbi:MAG: molybdopterin-dependent oxidoreductase [Methylotetracoccus sp.]|jgi:assimilatory nitrate reductase catalytic subunit|nr:molybdopterin-dependent oxidoreductase [Methylotetracoccus sp.]
MAESTTESGAVRTTCPYCGVGCGVLAIAGSGAVRVQGDPGHPANFGRLCSKGSALGDTLSLESRLLFPEIEGKRVSWDLALHRVAERFGEVIRTEGPDAVAFYVSGQLVTEDYYVANKLMKGFIGSANIDTNSRLCMASSVAAHKRAFGEDLVPGCYEDLEQADLLVLAGSNAAWCHPVLYQRAMAAAKRNPHFKSVVIDPRRTATGDSADLHLAIRPGSDVVLFAGLLDHLRRNDHLNHEFLERRTEGMGAALKAAREIAPSIPVVAAVCGLAETDVATFYHWFARTEKVVTAWSQGVNQSSSGTDKVNAIINVHLATGRIGRPGMGPFSLTGQPNAMGGREVGGLANQLAAHLEIENPSHRVLVQCFWNAPTIARAPGLKAVDLFRAVGEGRIKALWIMATNPAVSLPDSNAVRSALAACPFVVISDCVRDTDLARHAHVLLPAAAWGEKDGTVTNSERRISRQRRFLLVPGEARPDWWIITEVARRMGFAESFPYRAAHEIFQEHASLSGHENHGSRVFDISRLAALDATHYERLEPIQWPVNGQNPAGSARLLSDGNRPLRLIPTTYTPPAASPDASYPLVLNTGRIRDQWHTMTRTGKTARLTAHIPEPYAELHPADAQRADILDGSLVRLTSRYGEVVVRARITADQRRASVFMPMHWSETHASNALVNALVNPVTDPISGEPESKHTPVAVTAYHPAWHGFLLSRNALELGDVAYRVTVRGDGCWRYELAGDQVPSNWRQWTSRLLPQPHGEWLEFADAAAGRYRCALIENQRLQLCLFISAKLDLPPRDWLAALFRHDALPAAARHGLLAGKPASETEDTGRIVCACFRVGVNTLQRAIQTQALTTTEQIGAGLKAGTNCGSCVPELNRLLQAGRSSPNMAS